MALHWKRTLPEDWHALYKDGDILSHTEALAREMIETYSRTHQLRGLYGELGHYSLDSLATPSQILTKLKSVFAHDARTWLTYPAGADRKTTGEYVLAFFEQDMEVIAKGLMEHTGINDPLSKEGIEMRAYIYKFGWKSLVDYVLGIMVLEHNITIWI